MDKPKSTDETPHKRDAHKKPEDQRAPMAQAMGIAYELMSISLEMALIPLGGYWLDWEFQMGPLFLLLGCVLGFSLGFYHLMKFAARLRK